MLLYRNVFKEWLLVFKKKRMKKLENKQEGIPNMSDFGLLISEAFS